MKPNLFLLLLLVPLESYLRFHCQIQGHEDSALFFSSKSCIALVLTRRSLIYFKFTFVYDAKLRVQGLYLFVRLFVYLHVAI